MTTIAPLLNAGNVPSSPGGTSTPPVVSTLQDVSDVVYNYNDAFSANAAPTSWGKLLWDKLSFLTREVTDPLEGAFRMTFDALVATANAVKTTVDLSATAINNGFTAVGNALGYAQPTTIRQQVDTLVAGGSVASWWSTVPFDATNVKWVAVANGVAVDVLVLPQECHAIVITLTSDPDYPVVNTYSGVPFRFKLGWWAEMAGAAVGERRFIDSETALLHHYGHLMTKIFIMMNRGGTFTYTAYKYTP